MVPESEWRWFGLAGHFICGRWCRFHLCTAVGEYLISTVGLFVHPRHSAGREDTESDWLSRNPDGEEIGRDRFYETMVFRCGKPCVAPGCNCGMPEHDGGELDFEGYQTVRDATEGHRRMCEKWARAAANAGGPS